MYFSIFNSNGLTLNINSKKLKITKYKEIMIEEFRSMLRLI